MALVWASLVAAGVAHALEPPQTNTVQAQAAAARQIEKTELAFGQTVAQLGVAAGFRRFAAPGAVMFTPDPAPAAPYLQALRTNATLVWRPQYIGVAPSGDLGFSLGPALYKAAGKQSGGYYLTIWKHAQDGAWRFLLDHGVDMPASVIDGPPLPLEIITTDPAAKPDLNAGLRESDAALNGDLTNGAARPFAARLDDQALAVRANRAVAEGRRRVLRLINDQPPILDAQLVDAGVSADGVLGYSYGKARWLTPAGMQPGYYVRVWRNAGQGWRLLVDQLAER